MTLISDIYCCYVVNQSSAMRVRAALFAFGSIHALNLHRRLSRLQSKVPRELLLKLQFVNVGAVNKLDKELTSAKEKKRRTMFRQFAQGTVAL